MRRDCISTFSPLPSFLSTYSTPKAPHPDVNNLAGSARSDMKLFYLARMHSVATGASRTEPYKRPHALQCAPVFAPPCAS